MKYNGTIEEATMVLNDADTKSGYSRVTPEILERLSESLSGQELRELKKTWKNRMQDRYSKAVLNLLENVK